MSVVASRAVEVVFGALSRLPLGFLQAVGAVVGRWMRRHSARFRQEFERNLLAAIPDADDALIADAAAHAGRVIFELPWVWRRPRAEVLARVVEIGRATCRERV